MLTLVNGQPQTPGESGERWLVVLASNNTPASLVIDGSDIRGMQDNATIAAGSIMLAPGKTYVAYEDGVFQER